MEGVASMLRVSSLIMIARFSAEVRRGVLLDCEDVQSPQTSASMVQIYRGIPNLRYDMFYFDVQSEIFK